MDPSTVLSECRRRWSLDLGEPLAGGHRSEVYAATRADGSRAVLKRGASPDEAAALRLWESSGATVRVLEEAPDLGALLLERLDPGTPMPRRSGTVTAAAAVLSALHAVAPGNYAFRAMAGTFPEHEREVRADLAHERRTRAEPERARIAELALPAAGDLMERLAADTMSVLLHGDFLTKNLLASGDRYRAIDPIPCLGDPAADVGMFAHDQPAASILDTAAELSTLLRLDVDRAVAWAVVWTVMVTAQAWSDDQAELDALVTAPTFRRLLGG
jgi:streptomycin 6-kinase